jgi:hypothetical protein
MVSQPTNLVVYHDNLVVVLQDVCLVALYVSHIRPKPGSNQNHNHNHNHNHKQNQFEIKSNQLESHWNGEPGSAGSFELF